MTGARAVLREQSGVLHDRVDAVFSHADLASRAGYGRFLQAQAAAHLPIEAALDTAGAEKVVADWAERRRAPLLLADLAALGLASPVAKPGPVFSTPAAIIGGIYVLEGSRLGGTLLRRAVAPGLPAAFLSAADSAAWRRLLQIIDESLLSEEEMATAVAAATSVFAAFERSGRRYLKVE